MDLNPQRHPTRQSAMATGLSIQPLPLSIMSGFHNRTWSLSQTSKFSGSAPGDESTGPGFVRSHQAAEIVEG